jgi:tetratricopeptide (TPR) repeat protein
MVTAHAPGKPDAAAKSVAAMSYTARSRLQPAMQMFLQQLHTEPGRPRTSAQATIFGLVRSVREGPGAAAFLERAAILHTDAAVFRDGFPPPPGDEPRTPQLPSRGPIRMQPALQPRVPPLLTNDRYLVHRDGRVVGEVGVEWNWPFARSLVDGLPETGRAFVSEWYHAVAAYMMAAGDQGGLRTHLQQAALTLPDDPHVLFDRGSLAEALGLPYNQTLRDDPAFWNAQLRTHVDLPSESETNGEAEKLYRRALEIDPGYMEARVRLARLLDRRGQHDEASTQIANALDAKPSGVLAFYAHIVAGRIAGARGRYGDGVDEYEAALRLFRDAQSARLGASHAGLMASDVAQALTPIAGLGASVSDNTDPWWNYGLGAGRDADALMAHLWARVPK